MRRNFLGNAGFLTVPLAIIIAGVIVGLSVIYAVGRNETSDAAIGDVSVTEESGAAENVKSVSVDDFIWGDANAPVKVVEFSDTECPFCKRFHYTMKQIVEEYNGQVAWVYRHFPLDALHSKARKEAEALECAGELGGNAKFWSYLDRLMELTPSNDGLDPAELPRIAQYVGLGISQFNVCLTSGRNAARVEEDYADGVASGAEGTPYSVIIDANGQVSTLEGAYPLPDVKAAIDKALGK